MKKLLLFLCLLPFLTIHGQQTVGLFKDSTGSLDGYVLFTPLSSDSTFLIDKCGYLVQVWASTYHPGQAVYLLEDGSLLRSGSTNNPTFTSGGNGGIIEKLDWNSNIMWSFEISSSTECQHHDILPMPNGNVLAIVWELKTVAEAKAAGRNPLFLGTSLWSEKIVELQPSGAGGATIVWEWHAWDHLIQQYDSTKANYDTVAEHPELINLNYYNGFATASDWLHCNAVAYSQDLDQVMINSHNFNEIWIIDHSTTTAEAATHSGGAHGKGGDLLYRWGNAAAYNRGTNADKKLFGQHTAHWIATGLKDAGNIMVFNNGFQRPAGAYSSIDIFQPPVDGNGNYSLSGSNPYGPDSCYWTYTAPNRTDFFAQNISGAQRLSNGNTIICEGPKGNFFEIDSSKAIVWKYVNPVGRNGPVAQGITPLMNFVFRCTLYEPGYAGFNGKTLTPGYPLEKNPLNYSCNMLTGLHGAANDPAYTVVNPFNKNIRINSEKGLTNATVILRDITGRIMESWKLTEETSLPVKASLADGLYILTVKTQDRTFSVRLVHRAD